MEDLLILTVTIKGTNIMGNPLLHVTGVAKIKGKYQTIEKDSPITSVPDFIAMFNGILEGEKAW